MTEDNVQQNAKAQMTIVTDLRFWDYLVQGQKQPHKFTRVEAFHDLLHRQHIALLTGEDEFLKGSALEFSKVWGWDRETVGRFLKNLQDMNVLTIRLAGKRMAVKLNIVQS